ncbi:MAG: TetR/AcrR family transcriptional regulator [Clostridiales bacterium]|nr:TetR/AcrR family transcriptional regulator [Clostridiales bacterium]
MASTEKTKYKLAYAMKELMEHYPVDKISVKQIVEICDVSRQTFYRNFQDKYDLVNWYFDKLAQKSFKQMGISLTLREALTKKFEFMSNEGNFFPAAFACESQNCLIEYDYECIYQFYSDFIKKRKEVVFTPEIEFMLKMYCRGSIYMTAQWAVNGMKTPPETITDWLIESLPPKLYDMFIEI